MAYAYPSRLEDRRTECNAMKRPGKPDTGNPFVRFDEGRGGNEGLTTTVGLTRLFPLRLLYPAALRYGLTLCVHAALAYTCLRDGKACPTN